MARAKRYWLMKCEPEAYTIDDLERDGTATWEGVRNFQARNYMRDDMKPGDGVLFYASNAEPSGVTGVAEISRAGYPDPFAFEEGHKYFDPKSNPANPTWIMVDLRFVEKFSDVIPLAALKETRGLADMMVVQKGSRLSVQPVTRKEFDIVVKLGRKKGQSA
jgi:predicted RNA-binding protein with PUA-like domain